MAARSLDAGYFDRLYASDPDPWRFQTSAYERDKYAASLAALPRPRYRRGIEIGCSIGVLTEILAQRCDTMLGVDVAEAALATARQRCATIGNVQFARMALPAEVPAGRFDLIILSEILYYFDAPTIAVLARTILAMAQPRADILLVHWLGPTPDYPLTGDAAVQAFLAAIGSAATIIGSAATTIDSAATIIGQQRQPDYRLDLLRC